MNRQLLTLILSVLFLTILLVIIILIIAENYSLFKNKIENSKLDKLYKRDLDKHQELIKDNRNKIYKFSSNSNINITIDTTPYRNDPSSYVYVTKYKEKKVKRNISKGSKITKLVLNIIFYVIAISLIVIGIYAKCNGNVLNFGSNAYITITSGSMSYKNEVNTYLETNNLDNQIRTYSLIGLTKVSDPSEIEVYGVYGYKNEETKEIVVHRIISETIIDGSRYFTFRGDANDRSDYYLVNESDVLYEYNGFSNYPLGLITSFINSYDGIIAIVYACIALFVLDIYDKKKDKIYLEYMNETINRLNQKEINSLGSVKEINI